jgi:hypothetical protein
LVLTLGPVLVEDVLAAVGAEEDDGVRPEVDDLVDEALRRQKSAG